MYVMIIARGYPSEKYPLNGIFEFDQAKALARMGCRVIYAAVDVRSLKWRRKWGLEIRSLEGVKVYNLSIPCGGHPDAMRVKLEYWGLSYLYRLIEKQEGKPDLLHAHFFVMGYQAARLKKEVGLPLVITEHSSMLTEGTASTVERHKAALAYRGADRLVVVSPHLRGVLAEQFKVEATFIPNMYDPTLFYFSEKKRKEGFKFISAGSLIARKRMALLIDAFHKFTMNKGDARLSIYGEGPERKNLEALIEKKNLTHLVKLCGYQHRKMIAKEMQESDCFILASSSEPFGVVYIEALACGLPVIATQCGGPEVFVNDSNGILVPLDDPEALAEAMRYLYDNLDHYTKEKIAADTREKFGPESVAEDLIELYEAVKYEKG